MTSSEEPTTSVLFVCAGNICRSPTAETVFRTLAERAGLASSIAVDSAGTGDWQVGQSPDARAVEQARLRGYTMIDRCARQFAFDDFDRFEWILAMDRSNLYELEALCPRGFSGHLGLFMAFAPEAGAVEVPDPYQGKTEDFERVLDLTERAARGLLDAVRESLYVRGKA
jgi:protein-tyrosine phosphatase